MQHLVNVAAGLLSLVHASSASSNLQTSISSDTLVKRPSDYFAMMKKTITSAMKDPQAPLLTNPDSVSFNTKKWLNRAEASLTKNPNIINQAISHYQGKQNRFEGQEGEARAYQKKELWANMSGHRRDRDMEDFLMDGEARYEKQINKYRASHLWASHYGTHQEARHYAAKEMNARAMKQVWNRKGISRAMALKYVKAEMIKFKEIWDQEKEEGDDLKYADEMSEHAWNAIGWNIRARMSGQGV